MTIQKGFYRERQLTDAELQELKWRHKDFRRYTLLHTAAFWLTIFLIFKHRWLAVFFMWLLSMLTGVAMLYYRDKVKELTQ